MSDKMIDKMIYRLMSFLALALIGVATDVAYAGQNEITGFRHMTCEADRCVIVESAKAWLSQGNGAFVAKGPATLEVLQSGKRVAKYSGEEIVSQPQLDMISVDSEKQLVLITLKTGKTEVLVKRAGGQ